MGTWPANLDGSLALDGTVSIDVRDDGLLRGDGVYEVLRVYDQQPFALREHLDRLQRSAERIRLTFDRARLEAEVEQIVTATEAESFDLRVVLTRGGRRLVLAEPLRQNGGHLRLTAVEYAPSRVLDEAKTLSYAANMLATRLAKEAGFDEALFVSPDNRVLEAPTATFFWIDRDGRVATPPLTEHILDSITRRILIELLDAREQECSLEEAHHAAEIFLASTTREVQAVRELDGTHFPAPGPGTAKAQRHFAAHVRTTLFPAEDQKKRVRASLAGGPH